MGFELIFEPKVEKFLDKSDKVLYARLIKKIEILKDNPYPGDVKSIKGESHLFRLRVGDYRIIYEVMKSCGKILIIDINKRAVIYRLRDEEKNLC